MTLADAAGRLSDELKKRHPQIPWDQVRGFRNFATHAYESLHLKQIDVIIKKDLPLVSEAVEQELTGEKTPETHTVLTSRGSLVIGRHRPSPLEAKKWSDDAY